MQSLPPLRILATTTWTVILGAAFCLASASTHATPPEQIRGVYLTSASFGERKIAETIHYAKCADLNAVVLHVKDPYGHVHWKSENPIAVEIGAIRSNGRLEAAVRQLKDNGIWVIAKQDLFQDTLLAEKKSDMAILDGQTGKPWRNKRDLMWAAPYDKRVWDYNIALAKELVALGVDEIQFDYVRFPSDGDLKRIKYPDEMASTSKIDTVAAFLKAASEELKPLGATISVDLFGFVAWKTDDFGVGQRLEEFAPHVDAICPMLYPSHFPSGFLGKKNPADFPREIMELSMQRSHERTKTEIRPWVQGFWYEPDDIIAQLDGIDATGAASWLIWNPSSNYTVTYQALAKRMKTTFPQPKLYPDLTELEALQCKEIKGISDVVNLTDYRKGRATLRLEASKDGKTSRYNNPSSVVATLDEAVMDQILEKRGMPVNESTGKQTKVANIISLICKDLGITTRGFDTRPIHVDWKGDCRFTKNAPSEPESTPATQPNEAG